MSASRHVEVVRAERRHGIQIERLGDIGSRFHCGREVRRAKGTHLSLNTRWNSRWDRALKLDEPASVFQSRAERPSAKVVIEGGRESMREIAAEEGCGEYDP